MNIFLNSCIAYSRSQSLARRDGLPRPVRRGLQPLHHRRHPHRCAPRMRERTLRCSATPPAQCFCPCPCCRHKLTRNAGPGACSHHRAACDRHVRLLHQVLPRLQGAFRLTGPAPIERLGPVCWLRISTNWPELAHDVGQPCAICVVSRARSRKAILCALPPPHVAPRRAPRVRAENTVSV